MTSPARSGPRDTGERETIECGLVFRSIGYKGVGLEGVPFDDRRGRDPKPGWPGDRVPRAATRSPGQYAVGWIKRGPSGVIGTNKKDAQETVDKLVEDAAGRGLPEPATADRMAIVELLDERAPDHVTFEGWQAIDAAEQERGKPLGRPRVKFVRMRRDARAARGATVSG